MEDTALWFRLTTVSHRRQFTMNLFGNDEEAMMKLISRHDSLDLELNIMVHRARACVESPLSC